MKKERIQYGMVGGDLNAFIGKVHRSAIAFEPYTKLTAGCFSTHPEKNNATAETFQLDPDRVYANYQEMARLESERKDRLDFIVIVTPNISHYDIAKEFLEKGFNVVCEKPLCCEIWQAEELARIVREKDLLFGVTYAYSGYPMVKFARQLINDGKIGDIININAEYPQEWLIDELSKTISKTAKFSGWRADPKVSGISNCVGDIGTHIEHTVSYMTGLRVKRVAAKTDYFEHDLDLNANMLLEFSNGAGGVYWSSQVAIGHMNSLRVRIYGTLGAIEWYQENPECLKYTPRGDAPQMHYRGAGYMKGRAAEMSRIPSGHIEGHFEAFANLYKIYMDALLKKANGEPLTENDLDFPNVIDGVEGVKFLHAVIKSGHEDAAWVTL
ncbi:MAG: Gfo/Idh/MocA family oxidoreductase [Bacillota bacterium]|nr:Gfo/Idh/MocA family oxidoreductase [Bacillota bacterium]